MPSSFPSVTSSELLCLIPNQTLIYKLSNQGLVWGYLYSPIFSSVKEVRTVLSFAAAASILHSRTGCMYVCMLSHCSRVQFFATLWTTALEAPLSMRFPTQERWSGLPCPPPGDLPHPGTEPASLASPAWQVSTLPLPGKPLNWVIPTKARV